MGNKNDKKSISKAASRKRTARVIQAVIALLLVVGMVVTGIVVLFLE